MTTTDPFYPEHQGPAADTKTWQFLNITEPSQSQKEEFKGMVKINAMRGFRKYQRLKRTAEYTKERLLAKKESSAVEAHVSPLKSAFLANSNEGHAVAKIRGSTRSREEENPRELKKYVPSHPQSLLGAGMVDPFDVEGRLRGGRKGYYINHFILAFAPAFLPIDSRLDQNPVNRSWFSSALSSPVLMNAILLFAAVCMDSLQGRPLGVDALYYGGKTICLLNEALCSGYAAITDSTVAAVALLVANENVTGNLNAITLHMTALKRMVDLRGGLTSLGWNGTLQMFISWQDLIASATTNRPPIFPCCASLPPSIIPESRLSESTQSFSIPTATLSIPSFEPSNGPYSAIPAILYEIRHLTLVVESFRRTRGATPHEMLAFSRARSKLEYRLLSIPTPENEVFGTISEQYICEVVRITAVIYINYILHEFDAAFAVLAKLKTRLMVVIGAGERGCEDTRPDTDVIMLWVMFMGGLLSENTQERTWFARRISRIVRRLRLDSWDEIEERLRRALWISWMRDVTCEALWTAVVAMLESEKTQLIEA